MKIKKKYIPIKIKTHIAYHCLLLGSITADVPDQKPGDGGDDDYAKKSIFDLNNELNWDDWEE